MDEKLKKITIRIRKELYEKIEEQRDQDFHSNINREINYALETFYFGDENQ